MKKIMTYIFLLLIIATSTYFAYKYYTMLGLTLTSDITKFASMTFILGFSITLLFTEFITGKINATLSAYKRELEKTAIGSTESTSKVKVLESKIAVLEKALDDALKK